MNSPKKLMHILSVKLNSEKSFSLLFSSIIALIIFCLIYFLIIPVLKLSNTGVANYVIDIFMHRGPIPYFIVGFFGLSIGFLLKHVMVLQFENYAFNILKNEIKESDELPTKCIYSDSLSFLKIITNENLKKYKKTLIYKRISQGMQHLFNSQDTNAMNEYYKQRSDIEYLEME